MEAVHTAYRVEGLPGNASLSMPGSFTMRSKARPPLFLEIRPMLPRTALIQLGKLVAKDIAGDGPGSDGLPDVGDALAAHPEAILELLDLIAKESRKQKANDALIEAFAFMVGQALEVLRFTVERNFPEAVGVVAAARGKVLSLALGGKR